MFRTRLQIYIIIFIGIWLSVLFNAERQFDYLFNFLWHSLMFGLLIRLFDK